MFADQLKLSVANERLNSICIGDHKGKPHAYRWGLRRIIQSPETSYGKVSVPWAQEELLKAHRENRR